MPSELVFYTNPQSRGRIVRWMLEEVGQPYRTELLDYETTMKAPAYLSVNPMGKVPALRHRDTIVTEAAAICAYLADAFPAAGAWRPRPATGCAAPTIAGCFSPPVRSRRQPATRCSVLSCRKSARRWSATAPTPL
ncbi:MAG: glutathione S-transferase N-terminal domain-containing protein [Stellaceae bacterium]